MLKSINLNGKKVPIPVPVRTLQDVVGWVVEHLLTQDRVITKISVDQVAVEVEEGHVASDIVLESHHRVDLRVDSPFDLSLQTLDASRNLTTVLERQIDSLAVRLWKLKENEASVPFVEPFLSDLSLLIDLIDHLILLVSEKLTVTNVKNVNLEIHKVFLRFREIEKNRHWKELSALLVKSLRSGLYDIIGELDGMQRSLFELQTGNNGRDGSSSLSITMKS